MWPMQRSNFLMKKADIFFVALALLFAAGACSTDDNIDDPVTPVPGVAPDTVPDTEIITIPVVVHVVNFSPAPFEISDEKIRSQINVLNEDFRKKNVDWTKTPAEFLGLVADVGIEFRLATTDPDGKPTSGIVRTTSTVTGFDGMASPGEGIESLSLYFSSLGGQDAWPNDRYLNIWIAEMSDRHGTLQLAGYANFPGSDPRIDGVVIDARAFGTLAPLNPNNELGRTATHEIGHWLNLKHIYGTNNSCEDGEDGDHVADTPLQHSQNLGSPTHPLPTCGGHAMFMNFMDRVDDQSMYMFTNGQKQRMRALFNKGGQRRDLYLNIRK